LSIIRQRALWFCSEGQMHDGIVELRRAELTRRTAAVAARANAADAKQKRADKATAEALLKAQNPDLLLEANIIDSQDRLGMMCAAECNLNTRDVHIEPDGWRCCANCDFVYCGKVACLKKRDAHIHFCLSRKLLREVEETRVKAIADSRQADAEEAARTAAGMRLQANRQAHCDPSRDGGRGRSDAGPRGRRGGRAAGRTNGGIGSGGRDVPEPRAASLSGGRGDERGRQGGRRARRGGRRL
jgi:hypothetical protein